MLLVSVAERFGVGRSVARLLCCPDLTERGWGMSHKKWLCPSPLRSTLLASPHSHHAKQAGDYRPAGACIMRAALGLS